MHEVTHPPQTWAHCHPLIPGFPSLSEHLGSLSLCSRTEGDSSRRLLWLLDSSNCQPSLGVLSREMETKSVSSRGVSLGACGSSDAFACVT